MEMSSSSFACLGARAEGCRVRGLGELLLVDGVHVTNDLVPATGGGWGGG